MTTLQFIKSLKYELRENEKMALLEILDRFNNGGNTIYATHSFIKDIENRHKVNLGEIQAKLSDGVPPYKVTTKRVGKDLDLI